MGATFFDDYPELLQAPKVPDNYGAQRYQGGIVGRLLIEFRSTAPIGQYKWKQTYAAIEGLSRFEPNEFDGFAIEYINPSMVRLRIQR